MKHSVCQYLNLGILFAFTQKGFCITFSFFELSRASCLELSVRFLFRVKHRQCRSNKIGQGYIQYRLAGAVLDQGEAFVRETLVEWPWTD